MSENASNQVKELEALYQQQMETFKKIQELNASLPNQEVSEYTFARAGSGEKVTLAELFGEHDKLVVVHNMGFSCPYCTLWADGFNGTEYFYTDKGVGFVVSSPDSPQAQAAGCEKRGWSMPMVSTEGTSFAKDMGYEQEGNPWPGVSTFVKDAEGKVWRTAHSPYGPGDQFCAVFHHLAMLGVTGY